MVSRIPILQCGGSTKADTGFVPTCAQFFAVGTFLILRSLSCARSCTPTQKKKRVSMCLVPGPSPNPSVKEFAVELSLLDFNFHLKSLIHVNRSDFTV